MTSNHRPPLTQAEVDAVEDCEYCGQRFDVSLPDSDEHRYECEEPTCRIVVCWDCRIMDEAGNNFCLYHDPFELEDSDGNLPTKEGLDRLRSKHDH